MIKDEVGQNFLVGIGELFVNFRQEAGLTQRQAAKLADSTQARLSDIENGKADLLILTIKRWAEIYGYATEIHFVPLEDKETLEFYESLSSAMEELETET